MGRGSFWRDEIRTRKRGKRWKFRRWKFKKEEWGGEVFDEGRDQDAKREEEI